MNRTFAAIALLMAAGSTVEGQSMETGFLNRTVSVDGAPRLYQVYVPAGYDGTSAWPVILFLHGAGERGSDGLVQTQVGIADAIRADHTRFPAIVVMPQVPRDSSWQGSSAKMALAALDRTIEEFRTDPARIYLTGLSMGGNGSWYLLYNHPDRFAAALVICGFISGRGPFQGIAAGGDGDPAAAIAQRIAHVPIRIVHGETDTVVPAAESRRMLAALEAAGGDVAYTELAGIGHNAWDPAFASPGLIEWLFAQRR